MKKQKYITPYCEIIEVGTISLMASSDPSGNEEVPVYDYVTDSDANMSNRGRGSNVNIWDTEW
jgi:hypothetical protein